MSQEKIVSVNRRAFHDYLILETLEAGLALGTHVTIGFDLTRMDQEALSRYRSLLTHYEPFTGTTTFGRGLRPQTFATQRGGTTYLGVLNRSQKQVDIRVPLATHGLRPLPGGDEQHIATAYDVESGQFLRLATPFTVTMPAESFRLFIARQEPGVLWTNSSFQSQPAGSTLLTTLRGPAGLPGYVYLACPSPRRVILDGAILNQTEREPAAGLEYIYDAQTGVLLVRYENNPAGHTLVVEY